MEQVDLKALWPSLLPFIRDPEVMNHVKVIYEDQFAWVRDPSEINSPLSKGEIAYIQQQWIYYPLATFMTIGKAEHLQLRSQLLRLARSPQDLEWWVWPGTCYWLNGNFFIELLRKALPEKHFVYASTETHGWVQDDRNLIYDLIYPYVDREEQTIYEKAYFDPEVKYSSSNTYFNI